MSSKTVKLYASQNACFSNEPHHVTFEIRPPAFEWWTEAPFTLESVENCPCDTAQIIIPDSWACAYVRSQQWYQDDLPHDCDGDGEFTSPTHEEVWSDYSNVMTTGLCPDPLPDPIPLPEAGSGLVLGAGLILLAILRRLRR